MDHLLVYILAGVVLLIVTVKYFQLSAAASTHNTTLKKYLSQSFQQRSLLSEALIYCGLLWLLMLSILGTDFNISGLAVIILYGIAICVVLAGVFLLIYNSRESFNIEKLKQRIKSERELENKVANSKKALYFLASAPVFILLYIAIELNFSNTNETFLGFYIQDIQTWKLWTVSLIWLTVYLLMVFCCFCLFKMSKSMLAGNLYGAHPLKYLRLAAHSLQLVAVILLIYSFVEGLLTNNADGSFLLKPIFWLSYFLLFVSLMLKYLSSVLQRAAKLKQENDLTI